MNRFMMVLRILAGVIVVFCLLDYFMGWGCFSQSIPFVMGFVIIYFFASMISLLIRTKSYYRIPPKPEDEDKEGPAVG